VRVFACLLVAATTAVAAGSTHGASPDRCPHLAGTLVYVRSAVTHALSLEDCSDRRIPTPSRPRELRSPQGRRATIRATRDEQTIVVDGRSVLRVHENRKAVPGGVPGPLGLVTWAPDGRTLFYDIDPMASGSLAADGLVLRALDVASGRTWPVAAMLLHDDYWTWCGSTLVLTAGRDRIATHDKRLVVARGPDWHPRVLWASDSRAFSSLTCAPDGRSVAVLSQRSSTDPRFFATRWRLWRVGLDGSHTLLDRPPPGWADESPAWSPDGASLAFVRERSGYGRIMVLHAGRVDGPLVHLGYSLGFYGHHDWGLAWRA
jgi:hypothetical protein